MLLLVQLYACDMKLSYVDEERVQVPVLILLDASLPSCGIFLVNLQVTISAKDLSDSIHNSP